MGGILLSPLPAVEREGDQEGHHQEANRCDVKEPPVIAFIEYLGASTTTAAATTAGGVDLDVSFLELYLELLSFVVVGELEFDIVGAFLGRRPDERAFAGVR